MARDRFRVVLLAGEGLEGTKQTREQIATVVGRSRQFVDQWVGRYRQLGLAGLEARKAKGNPPSLTPVELETFKKRMLAGPTDADNGKCTLRGVRRPAHSRSGVWQAAQAQHGLFTDAQGGIILPAATSAASQKRSGGDAQAAGENKHIVLVLDGAGWHSAKALAVPDNMTLLPLPPYSPELNPAERIWRYMRGNYLSNRAYKDYD